MIINKITHSEYGKFNNRANLEFGQGINLIYGPNEAGKTTLYNMILEILFGFSPANREAHIYKNDFLNGMKISAQVNDFMVERQMLSQVSGSLIEEDIITRVGNNSIVHNEYVTREVYREVFAVSSDDLVDLKDKTWTSLEDKILGKINHNNTPVREIVNKISEEMKTIAKASKRGNSKIKSLESRRVDLWKKRRQTVEVEEKLRLYTKKLEREEGLLESLLSENKRIKKGIHHHTKYHEYIIEKALLETKEKYRHDLIEKYGEAIGLIDLAKMDQWKEAIEALKNKRVHSEQTKVVFNQEEILLARDIAGFTANYKRYSNYLIEREAIEKDLLELSEEKIKLWSEIENTIGLCNEDIFLNFTRLNIPKLKAVLEGKKNRKDRDRKTGVGEMIMILSALLIGIGLYFFKNQLYLGFFAFGGLNIVRNTIVNKGIGNNKKQAQDKEREILEALADVFNHDQVRKISLSVLDEIFYNKCIALKDQSDRVAKKINALTLKRENISAQISLTRLSFKGVHQVVDVENITWVESLIETTMNKMTVNRTVDQNKDLMTKEIQYYEDLLVGQNQYVKAIDALCEGDCLDIVNKYKDLCETIDKMRRILANNVYYANISEEVSNLSKKMYNDVKHSDILKLNEDLLENNENIDGTYNRINEIKKENFVLEEMDSLTVIDSEIRYIEEEIEDQKNQWNILNVLKRTIEISEAGFRNRVQPELLRKAECYLSKITSGIHEGLLFLDEDGKKKIVLETAGERVLSKGTYQQVYLALRVALMDLIDDEAHETKKLPIFFDELLAHWDNDRSENLMALLKVVSKERQIFMFTCKKEIRDLFNRDNDVKVIELG